MKTKDARKAFSNDLKKEKSNNPKANNKLETSKKLSSRDQGVHDQEDELICIRSTN